MALQEPVPGQQLTATWGRDVVREIKRLRPTAGPGMRLSYGPNGTTFTPVLKNAQAQGVQGNYIEILPFRLGVGTETVTSGTTTTVKFHKVAITPAVMIDETEYAIANIIVPDDSKLVGLPLPKAGSGLPWVWIKDASLTDITNESENRTTEAVFIHLDHKNHVCVLSNSETITATEYEDEDGNRHQFNSDEWIVIGRFDLPEDEHGKYDATKKPQVISQYIIGAVVWKVGWENTPYPFQLRIVEEPTQGGETESRIIVYFPTIDDKGILSEIDNEEFVNAEIGYPEDSGWYKPYISAEEGATEIIIRAFANYVVDEHGVEHFAVTVGDDESAPAGYEGGMAFVVGTARIVDEKWAVENSVIGAIIYNGIGYDATPKSTPGIFEGDNTGDEKYTPDFNFEGAISYFTQPYLNLKGVNNVWVPHVHLTGDDLQKSPVGWERGKTAWKNGHNVNDPTDLDPETGEPYKPVGASIKIVSHVIRRSNTSPIETRTEFFFTQLDFDENGQLIRAIPCTDWFVLP